MATIFCAKINAVISALAEGFRGKGEAIGQAITDFNQVLLAVNPRTELIRADWRAFKGFNDAYGAAAAEEIRRVVTIFRELRSGRTEDGLTALKIPSGSLSTAEAISVVTTGMPTVLLRSPLRHKRIHVNR